MTNDEIRMTNVLFFVIFVLIYGIAYAQDDYLDVKGNIKVDTLTFKPFAVDDGGLPSTPVEGELFYDHSNTDVGDGFINEPVYHNSSAWQGFISSQSDKFVATHIVAASDSKDPQRAEADYRCITGQDCAQVINQAINDLPAVGGSVYLLDGTYSNSILNPITINKSDVSLIGAGYNTVLSGWGNMSILIADASRVLISQLAIDGDFLAGIRLLRASHSKIDKVLLRNITVNGINLVSSSNNTITDCGIQFPNAEGEGIRVDDMGDSPSAYNIISGNHIINTGINVYGSNNNTIIKNNVVAMGFVGVRLTRASGNIVSANNIMASSSPNSAYGIRVTESSRNTVSDNTISSAGEEGIYFEGSDTNHNLISGNTITGNVNHSILVLDAWSNSITGNVINDSNTADAIRLESDTGVPGSKYNLIASNLLNYWLNIKENCTNNYIVGNHSGYYDVRIDDGSYNSYTDVNKLSITRMPVPYQLTGSHDTQTLDPNNYNSLTLTYLPVQTVGATKGLNRTTPIAAGKTPGELLMLEGANYSDTYLVGVPCYSNTTRLNDTGCALVAGVYYRPLGGGDYLELIWNGEKWLEVAYSKNRSTSP